MHKKSNDLEVVLKELNESIESIDFGCTKETDPPIVLICGCARSGSTLMLQTLANTGIFSYPTNLAARFYKNPAFGIKVQQALVEFDPINQIGFSKEVDFSSKLGKTFGAMAPSEYWYYWRQFFSFGDTQRLSSDEFNAVDMKAFIHGLAQFQNLTGKPLTLKGMMLNWNLSDLYNHYKNFVFLVVEREPFFNAQSLLFAREKYYGDRSSWYSFKPEEYTALKDKSPIEQVAGQVVYTNNAIERELKLIPEKNVLKVTYENFCSSPEKTIIELCDKVNLIGSCQLQLDRNRLAKVAPSIEAQNSVRISSAEAQELRDYIHRYQEGIEG